MKTYVALLSLLLVAAFSTARAQAQPPRSDNGAENFRLVILQAAQNQQPQALLEPMPDNGVYLTADDFMRGNLIDAFAENTASADRPGEHIWASAPGGYITVETPLVTEKFPEAKTWGFRKDGKDFRIVNGLTYEVVNHSDILMYRIINPDVNNYPYATLYFFSRYPDSDLFQITKRNLEMVYSDHPAFVNTLKTADSLTLKSDSEPISGGTALYFFRQAETAQGE